MAVSLDSDTAEPGASGFSGEAHSQASHAGRKRLVSLLKIVWGWLFSFWPLLLAPALILPGMAAFPYPSPEEAYSDLAITHYPAAVYLLRALRDWHTIPLWSPAILGGYPFMANPLSGLWYPPGWLALVFPLPLGFNLLVALHLLWAGWGAYRLLRSEGLSHPAALLGGLVFSAMPKLFAHYGAGHLSLIYAVAWTPWLLWAARRAIRPGGEAREGTGIRENLRTSLLPSVVYALILLADVRWGAYAGLLWWVYSAAHSQILEAGSIYSVTLRRFSRVAGRLIHQSFLAGMLAAPLLIPFIEYTSLSTRVLMDNADVMAFSLPPARLLGLLFPDLGGYHEWTLYPGSFALGLALWGFAAGNTTSHRFHRFWGWAALCTLVYSLGSVLPLLPALAGLPLLNLLRVPPRALFLFGLAVAALSAYGMDSWLALPDVVRLRRARLATIALGSLVLALAASLWSWTGGLAAGFAWGAAAIFLAVAWILARTRFTKRLSLNVWYCGTLGLLVLDLAGVDLQSFTPRNPHDVLKEGATLAGYLQEQGGTFRVYSPSYSLPQHSAALAGLELADGVDPVQLQSYARFMEKASGVPAQDYSVTLPPFSSGIPASANRDYRPDPDRLARLNVHYVASEFDLPVEGLELRARFGNTRLYENLKALPRAWVQPTGTIAPEATQPVDRLVWEPNQINIQAQGPGLLVVAENYYPGWRAWVDSRPAALVEFDGLLRAVDLSPGKHQVRLSFRPFSLYLGLALWLLALSWIALRCATSWTSLRSLFRRWTVRSG